MEQQIHTTHSEQETVELGKLLARRLVRGDSILLYGDLGAGKTEFARGICEELQVEDIVSSPTFTIINQYFATLSDGEDATIYHIDLYRIDSPDELKEIGFSECVHSDNSIKIIEWPEKGSVMIDGPRYEVRFTVDDVEDDKRVITITYATGSVQS